MSELLGLTKLQAISMQVKHSETTKICSMQSSNIRSSAASPSSTWGHAMSSCHSNLQDHPTWFHFLTAHQTHPGKLLVSRCGIINVKVVSGITLATCGDTSHKPALSFFGTEKNRFQMISLINAPRCFLLWQEHCAFDRNFLRILQRTRPADEHASWQLIKPHKAGADVIPRILFSRQDVALNLQEFKSRENRRRQSWVCHRKSRLG